MFSRRLNLALPLLEHHDSRRRRHGRRQHALAREWEHERECTVAVPVREMLVAGTQACSLTRLPCWYALRRAP